MSDIVSIIKAINTPEHVDFLPVTQVDHLYLMRYELRSTGVAGTNVKGLNIPPTPLLEPQLIYIVGVHIVL